MRSFLITGILTALGFTGFAATSRADFFLRVPFVDVQVNRGGGVYVGAPGVQVQVPPAPYTVVVPQPRGVIVSEPLPAPTLIAPPTLVPSVAVLKPMTVEQFVAGFQPLPGRYEVVLVHPKSCQPVKVCFELPATGCAPKVRYTRHVLEFEYPKCDVRIRFYHDGDVKVLY